MARRLRLYQAVARGFTDPAIEQFVGFDPPDLKRRTRGRWAELFGFIEEYTNPGIAQPAAGFEFLTITRRRHRALDGFFGLLETYGAPAVPDFLQFQDVLVSRRGRDPQTFGFSHFEAPAAVVPDYTQFQLPYGRSRSRYPDVAGYPASFLMLDEATYVIMPPFVEFVGLGGMILKRTRDRWQPPACEQDQEQTVWSPFDIQLWSCAPDSSFVVKTRGRYRIQVLGQSIIGFPADDPLVGYIPPPLASVPGYITPALRRWRDDQP